MGYTKDAIAGFGWQTLLKGAQTVLTFIKIFILARLLSPTDFGLFSLVAIALGLTEAFTQTGVNLTIVQSKQSVKYFIDTAWVIAIIRGISIAICMLVVGLAMGAFYQEPNLPFYIALATLIPIIKGFINPSIVSLHKNLQFFQESLYYFALAVSDLILAVTFGFFIRSVEALLLAMIGTALIEVLLSFIFFKEKPKFKYIHSRASVIFANAKWLGISSLLSYLNENSDDFILGKTVGTHNLGLYHAGYSIGHKGSYEIAKSASHGTLPIYTKIVADTVRLRKAFFKSLAITLSIGLAASVPLLVAPELIVRIVLGENWSAVTTFLPFLALAGLLQAIVVKSYTLLYATKQYGWVTIHQFGSFALMIILIYILSKDSGVIGAALGIVAARTITLPLLALGIRKTIST